MTKPIIGKIKPKTIGVFEILQINFNGRVTICLRHKITNYVNVWCTLSYQKPTSVQSYLVPSNAFECYAQLWLSRDSSDFSCVDSCFSHVCFHVTSCVHAPSVCRPSLPLHCPWMHWIPYIHLVIINLIISLLNNWLYTSYSHFSLYFKFMICVFCLTSKEDFNCSKVKVLDIA